MQANDESGAGVELHYEIVGLNLVDLINAEDAIASALPGNRDGLRYLMLCPTDRVMHNIVHTQLHHERHRKKLVDLRQMVDLALLVDKYGGTIDSHEIQCRFASAGEVGVLRGQVGLLREMFECDVPVTVPSTAAIARLRHAIINQPTMFTMLREIAAYYWAYYRRQPLMVINLLNPLWWPQRIRLLRARYNKPVN